MYKLQKISFVKEELQYTVLCELNMRNSSTFCSSRAELIATEILPCPLSHDILFLFPLQQSKPDS